MLERLGREVRQDSERLSVLRKSCPDRKSRHEYTPTGYPSAILRIAFRMLHKIVIVAIHTRKCTIRLKSIYRRSRDLTDPSLDKLMTSNHPKKKASYVYVNRLIVFDRSNENRIVLDHVDNKLPRTP